MSHPLRFIFTFTFFFLPQFLNSSSSPSSTPFKRPLYPCKPPDHDSYSFCNTSLSLKTRAQSLISLLTLQEKIQQLSNNASSIPRLGIPAYEWWSESLHGIATNGPGVSFTGAVSSATSFPQVLLTAAAFNRSLWYSIGSAIAVEARAMYNVGQAGLTFWAPNVNIFRDPRWGRGQETPGEDPMVASAYAIEFVRGFERGNFGKIDQIGDRFAYKRSLKGDHNEDDDGEGLIVSACCKHFTAYDLENWKSFSRYSFNSVVTEQDLEDTYQPPFRSCVEQGKASCLMCSYNEINGIPACAREDLLKKARIEWGFNGYITSDCDAVATVQEYQHYAKTPEDAIADVLKAGTDINCGTFMLRNTLSAIEQGKVKEDDIDRALLNLLTVQLRLGLFDGDPQKGKFGNLGPKDVCASQHKTLALEAARQGIVLLKNDKNFLPLKKNLVSSLAVIGPVANDSTKLGGGYTGIPCNPKSIVEGFQQYIETTSYSCGCLDVPCDSDNGFDDAIRTAKEVDYVILVMGLDLSQETEDRDRVSLLLPGKQMALVSSIASASSKPVILILTGGGPLDVSFAETNPKIASIFWIGYPGEAGGRALAEVIFGDHNPGGRLPMTWYPESFTDIPMNDMNMRSDPSRGYPGRTYRFYIGSRIYGFGQGLSYTSFTYRFISLPKKVILSSKLQSLPSRRKTIDRDYLHINEVESCDSLRLSVQISVTNVGEMDGSHVVMLFSKFPEGFEGSPRKQLIGFDRVATISRKSIEVNMTVDPCKHLTIVDREGNRIIPFGDHVLTLGDIEHAITIENSY